MDDLIVRVGLTERTIELVKARAASGDPWFQPRGAAGAEPSDVRGGMAPPADEPLPGETSRGDGALRSGNARAPRPMPLRMPGPLGAIQYKDRPMFDDKVMMHQDYAYNGSKGGSTWKSKVERYFITKAPCLREVLEWAECEDNEAIDESKFKRAVSDRLTEEQALNVNSQIWGFLSGCLTGSAEVMFRRAEWLNGVDAWRRVVRQIDHGRAIRLETLRRDVNCLSPIITWL